MRNTRMIGALVVACAALASGGVTGTAHAGQGTSQYCNDGLGGGTEIPIVSTPITLHVDFGSTYVQVCYSTTSLGSGAPAVTGGLISINDIGGIPSVYCAPDTSPTVVAVSCSGVDADPSSPGRRYTISIRVQETVATLDVGIELGTPGSPVCLRGFTVWGPTGQIGPFDIGVC